MRVKSQKSGAGVREKGSNHTVAVHLEFNEKICNMDAGPTMNKM
jgi:hypothetical protein